MLMVALLKSGPNPYRVVLFPPSKCRSFKRARRKEKSALELSIYSILARLSKSKYTMHQEYDKVAVVEVD